MKKSPHGLKIDKRKTMLNNLKDNGLLEQRKENRSEGSGLVRLKRSAIKKLERKITETTDQSEIKKMESEIEKKEQQIENYLNK